MRPKVITQGHSDLMQVIDAAGAVGHFAQPLHCWEEHSRQYGNDADDHQEFQEGKAATPPSRRGAALHGRIPIVGLVP